MKNSREKEEAEVEGMASLYETFNILDSRFNEKNVESVESVVTEEVYACGA